MGAFRWVAFISVCNTKLRALFSFMPRQIRSYSSIYIYQGIFHSFSSLFSQILYCTVQYVQGRSHRNSRQCRTIPPIPNPPNFARSILTLKPVHNSCCQPFCSKALSITLRGVALPAHHYIQVNALTLQVMNLQILYFTVQVL